MYAIRSYYALEMRDAVMAHLPGQSIFISCAAVADYRVAEVASQKIKKSANELTLRLVKNPDIIAEVAARADKPFVVGFAAETEKLAEHARDKLSRKGLDLIAANDVARAGQGFNADRNALTLFWADGQLELPLTGKRELARQLLTHIVKSYRHDPH